MQTKTWIDASTAFVKAMDSLIDGLKEIAQFFAKAAELSEKLRANMVMLRRV